MLSLPQSRRCGYSKMHLYRLVVITTQCYCIKKRLTAKITMRWRLFLCKWVNAVDQKTPWIPTWFCSGLWIHPIELLRTCLHFLIWHEIINSCISLPFPAMHSSHLYECWQPVQGPSCPLMNFCSYFIGWIFTMSHCVILLTCCLLGLLLHCQCFLPFPSKCSSAPLVSHPWRCTNTVCVAPFSPPFNM